MFEIKNMNDHIDYLYSQKKLVDNGTQLQLVHATIHSLKIAAQGGHSLFVYSIYVLCRNAVVKVSLRLLGPCEMPLQHVASGIPAIGLPGNAHLTFHYTTERWHCMLQLL